MSFRRFEPDFYRMRVDNIPFLFAETKENKYEIKQIYVNMKKGATTVLWEDGTHTTVKLNINTERYCPFDLYYAVCAALAKKVYGSNTHFKKIIEEKTVTQEKKGKKK